MSTKYSRRLRLIAAPVAAFSLILAACGDDSGGVTAGTSSIGKTNDINPKSREEMRDGGNLRLPTGAFPATFNPHHIDSDGDVSNIQAWTLPGPATSDVTGEISTDNDFFSDIQLTGTDPQRIVYTINPKAVWSDGSPITWEDMRSQAEALSGRNTAYKISASQGYSRLDKVERGADDRQAIVTFAQHYAEWRGLFSQLVPKELTATPEAFDNLAKSAPVKSAGPFIITDLDRSKQRIVLSRNPKWWGETPKLDTVTYSVLDRAAYLGALQNNELDAFDLSGLEEVTAVTSTPGLVVRRASRPYNSHFTFNGAPGAILSDPRLRLAISKAIDRQSIVSAIQNGIVADPKPLNNHIYLNGQKGYQDNAAVVAYDPAAAARMLDELGWKLNGQFREKDGRQLVLRDVMYRQDTWIQTAQIAQQNLAQVGVKLEIETYGGELFTDVVDPGNFDIVQFSWQRSAFPLGALPQIYSYDPNNVLSNKGRIGSPELNALIEEVISELDPEKAIELANKADTMIFEMGHSLPIAQSAGNVAVRDNVANFGAFGLADTDYTKVGFVK
ncbi:ABC transporter family substrate-binding protein [Nocardia sp. NPDC051832]|uniref:ABC transporter family substrate-binding protein n=1 Tax=Nocardia sp. NPDC051832 TaxID=3155673 RepID=UPI00342A903A